MKSKYGNDSRTDEMVLFIYNYLQKHPSYLSYFLNLKASVFIIFSYTFCKIVVN